LNAAKSGLALQHGPVSSEFLAGSRSGSFGERPGFRFAHPGYCFFALNHVTVANLNAASVAIGMSAFGGKPESI
jgi:hypothetical protein